MKLFTTTQANACIVRRCESEPKDTHAFFVFAVTDNNGISYEWTDDQLAEDATNTQKKTAIADHLKTIQKKAVVSEGAPEINSIVGTKVSDI